MEAVDIYMQLRSRDNLRAVAGWVIRISYHHAVVVCCGRDAAQRVVGIRGGRENGCRQYQRRSREKKNSPHGAILSIQSR